MDGKGIWRGGCGLPGLIGLPLYPVYQIVADSDMNWVQEHGPESAPSITWYFRFLIRFHCCSAVRHG